MVPKSWFVTHSANLWTFLVKTLDFRVRSFVALDSEVVSCGHDLGDLRVIAMESNVSGPREGENNSFIDTSKLLSQLNLASPGQ